MCGNGVVCSWSSGSVSMAIFLLRCDSLVARKFGIEAFDLDVSMVVWTMLQLSIEMVMASRGRH
jgi:hypothetical protein